jgi:hypothetical protein
MMGRAPIVIAVGLLACTADPGFRMEITFSGELPVGLELTIDGEVAAASMDVGVRTLHADSYLAVAQTPVVLATYRDGVMVDLEQMAPLCISACRDRCDPAILVLEKRTVAVHEVEATLEVEPRWSCLDANGRGLDAIARIPRE